LNVSENCGLWVGRTFRESRHETFHNVWHSKLHVSVSRLILHTVLDVIGLYLVRAVTFYWQHCVWCKALVFNLLRGQLRGFLPSRGEMLQLAPMWHGGVDRKWTFLFSSLLTFLSPFLFLSCLPLPSPLFPSPFPCRAAKTES